MVRWWRARPPAEGPVLPRRTRWLADDTRRAWLVGLPMVVVVLVLSVPGDAGASPVLMRQLVAYTVMLVLYPALTLVAFAGLEGAELEHALGEARRRQVARSRRPWGVLVDFRRRPSGVGGDGPTWPVLLAIAALVISVLLVASADLRSVPLVVASGIVMIGAAWVGCVVAYAVHDARLAVLHGGLRFPAAADPGHPTAGDEPRTFGDYLYLSLGVQASFGPSDVQVTTRRMRRVVAGHMVIGWVFNTVILAALVSGLVALA